MRHQDASWSRFHCISCNIPFNCLEDQKEHYFNYHSKKVIPTSSPSNEKLNVSKSVEFKCEPCNIVCLSAIAYDFHTQGKKHKAAVSLSISVKSNHLTNGKIGSETKNVCNTTKNHVINNFLNKNVNTKEKNSLVVKDSSSINGKSIKKTNTPTNTVINNFIKKKDVKIVEVNKLLKITSEEPSKTDRTAEIISRIKQRVSLPVSDSSDKNTYGRQSSEDTDLTNLIKLENGTSCISSINDLDKKISEKNFDESIEITNDIISIPGQTNVSISNDIHLNGSPNSDIKVNDEMALSRITVLTKDCMNINGETMEEIKNAPANTAINNFIKNKDGKICKGNEVDKTSEIIPKVIQKIPLPVSNSSATITHGKQYSKNLDLSDQRNFENGKSCMRLQGTNKSLISQSERIHNEHYQSTSTAKLLPSTNGPDIYCQKKPIFANKEVSLTKESEVVGVQKKENSVLQNEKVPLLPPVNKSQIETSNTCATVKNEMMLQPPMKSFKDFYCNICSIDCNSSITFKMHNASQKHTKNLEKKKTKVSLPATLAIKTSLTDKEHVSNANGIVDVCTTIKNETMLPPLMESSKEYYCKLCLVYCHSQVNFICHNGSAKHKKALEKSKEATKVVSQGKVASSGKVAINGDQKVNQYSCNECVMTFSSRELLRDHYGSATHRSLNSSQSSTSDSVLVALPIRDVYQKDEFFCVDCNTGYSSMDEHVNEPNHVKMVQLKTIDNLKQHKDPLVYCDVCDLYFLPNLKDWHFRSDKHKRETNRDSSEEPANKKRRVLDIKTNVNYCRYCAVNLYTEPEALVHYQSQGHLTNFDKANNPDNKCALCAITFTDDQQLKVHFLSFKHYEKVNENNMNPEGEHAERLIQQRVLRSMRPPRRCFTDSKSRLVDKYVPSTASSVVKREAK